MLWETGYSKSWKGSLALPVLFHPLNFLTIIAQKRNINSKLLKYCMSKVYSDYLSNISTKDEDYLQYLSMEKMPKLIIDTENFTNNILQWKLILQAS